MSTIRTCLRLVRSAWPGATLRDKTVAFQCASLHCMGLYRQRVRAAFMRSLHRQARDGQVSLSMRLDNRLLTWQMRQDNHADYGVAGEIVLGAYRLPPHLEHQPSAIIDGGANIGCFTLRAHARFPKVPITCYEPDAQNLAQLRRNLESNGIAATVVPKALWSRAGRLFYHPGQSDAGYVDENQPGEPIEVTQVEAPDGCWLKLDVEGAEYEVLPHLLQAGKRPAIISLEIHQFDRRGLPLIETLLASGYRVTGPCGPTDFCVNITAYHEPS
jgi:FkbM family methyltransferase